MNSNKSVTNYYYYGVTVQNLSIDYLQIAGTMNNERYRLPGHCSPLSHALLLPGVMEEERGESGFGPHSVYQLDGPGPAVHAMGHVKYEEESENKNILKYLLYSIE